MALMSPGGAYLRIRKIEYTPGERSAIRYELYRSEETRRDGPGPFDAIQAGDVRTAEATEALASAIPGEGVTAGDALVSAAYDHLRSLEQFAEWADA